MINSGIIDMGSGSLAPFIARYKQLISGGMNAEQAKAMVQQEPVNMPNIEQVIPLYDHIQSAAQTQQQAQQAQQGTVVQQLMQQAQQARQAQQAQLMAQQHVQDGQGVRDLGVAGLPVHNVGNEQSYARGGIVAFDEGGGVKHFAEAGPVSNASAQPLTWSQADEDRFQKLRALQEAPSPWSFFGRGGEGEGDFVSGENFDMSGVQNLIGAGEQTRDEYNKLLKRRAAVREAQRKQAALEAQAQVAAGYGITLPTSTPTASAAPPAPAAGAGANQAPPNVAAGAGQAPPSGGEFAGESTGDIISRAQKLIKAIAPNEIDKPKSFAEILAENRAGAPSNQYLTDYGIGLDKLYDLNMANIAAAQKTAKDRAMAGFGQYHEGEPWLSPIQSYMRDVGRQGIAYSDAITALNQKNIETQEKLLEGKYKMADAIHKNDADLYRDARAEYAANLRDHATEVRAREQLTGNLVADVYREQMNRNTTLAASNRAEALEDVRLRTAAIASLTTQLKGIEAQMAAPGGSLNPDLVREHNQIVSDLNELRKQAAGGSQVYGGTVAVAAPKAGSSSTSDAHADALVQKYKTQS